MSIIYAFLYSCNNYFPPALDWGVDGVEYEHALPVAASPIADGVQFGLGVSAGIQNDHVGFTFQ